jgi:uncharacterized membrane protein YiaA
MIKKEDKEMIMNYLKVTWRNKVCAVVLILIGLCTFAIDHDATILLLMTLFGIPLFITKQNCILTMDEEP